MEGIMKTATFKLVGKKAFLYHKFNISNLTDQKRVKEGNAGNCPSEWRDTYFSEGTKLFIPDDYFFATFVGGGKYVKVGRGTISKKLAGTLEITNEKHFIENRKIPKKQKDLMSEHLTNDTDKDVYIDCRMVSNPNTKGRNVRYRLGMSPGWRTTCRIKWDDSIVSRQQVEAAVTESGSLVGIGDGRAIGYGRFEVSDFICE